MKSNTSIYKSGYSFVQDNSKKKQKALLIGAVIFLGLFVIFSLVRFIFSLGFFKEKEEVVSTLASPSEEESVIKEVQQSAEAYQNAGIPYSDPDGLFAIDFLTTSPSGKIEVVILSRDRYDEAKQKADQIINAAKSKVSITYVIYTNAFN